MKQIAVLMTVFNRKQQTLKCLENLFTQKGVEDYSLEVWLTNDGCTDGTPEAIREQFPQVHVIEGDGSLYWNRGMYKAWEAAAKAKDYDFYLWLNDDTMLFDDALSMLLNINHKKGGAVIVVGSICSPENHDIVTYGGKTYKGIIHPLEGLRTTREFNGNVVLIPRCVYEKTGFNDPYYTHAFGDGDYGLSAHEQGFVSYVTDSFIGTCARHDKSRKCWNPDFGLFTRVKFLFSPLGYPPKEVFYYHRKHYGLCRAVDETLRSTLRAFFPKKG